MPVELLLQTRLGVRDSAECAQRSRELLATCGARSDAGHRAQMLYDPDSTLTHASLLPYNAGRRKWHYSLNPSTECAIATQLDF